MQHSRRNTYNLNKEETRMKIKQFETGRVYDFPQVIAWEAVNRIDSDEDFDDYIIHMVDPSRGLNYRLIITVFKHEDVSHDDVLDVYDSTNIERKQTLYEHDMSDELKEAQDNIIIQAELNKYKTKDNKVYVVERSIDCDQYERTSLHEIEATPAAWKELQDMVYGDVEVSANLWIIDEEEAEEFKPESRDRILEAFENGNGTSVII